jgi:hemoglobin
MRRDLRRAWPAAMAAGLLALAAAAPARAADDKTGLDPKAVDSLVFNSLRDVINEGADMYNAEGRYKNMERDFAGCYHLYEGALLATRPLLAHRPNLQKGIDDGLSAARETPEVWRRAVVLRAVIDKVRADVNPNPAAPGGASVWDRLGGEAGVTKVVEDWAAAATADEKLDVTRGGKYLQDEASVKKLKRQLVEQISSLTGGPLKYEGRPMKEVHKGMGITDEQFDLAVKHLKEAFKGNGVKDEDAGKLLDAVEETRKDIVEKKEPLKTTLWDRLGGEAGVTKIVNDFVAAAAADKKANFYGDATFKPTEEQDKALKANLVAWLSAGAGGPRKYEGNPFRHARQGKKFTDEEFDAVLKDLRAALVANGVVDPDLKDVQGFVEATRKDVVEARPEPPKGAPLWDRLGGEPAVAKVVDDFVAAAAEDKEVNFFRKPDERPSKEQINALKSNLIDFISAATGGPRAYKGRNMKEAHKDMHITDKEFDAAARDLENALKKNGVKEAEARELMALVEGNRKDIVEKKGGEAPGDKDKPAGAAVVAGKVTYNGKPLPGGFVLFQSADGKTARAEIKEDGTYRADALAPGDYKVGVDTESLKPKGPPDDKAKPPDAKGGLKYLPVPAKYRDPTTSGLTLTVNKGEQTHDIALDDGAPPKEDKDKPKPEEKASLKGRVTYKGQPLPGAVLTLVDEAGEKTVTLPIAEDGTFKAEGLAPGRYNVAVDTELLKPDPDKPADPKAAKYVKIPAKYRDPKLAVIKFELKKGEQTVDVDLTD